MPADRRAVVSDLFGDTQTNKETRVDPKAQAESLVSRYAEFMVCAYLSKLGHRVHHIDTAGFDLILEYESRSYRIDVKSTGYTYIGPRKEMAQWSVRKAYWNESKGARVRRMMTPEHCDILALFHNTFATVVYYPVVKPLKEVRLPLSQVRNTDYGEASLKAAVIAKAKSGTAWR